MNDSEMSFQREIATREIATREIATREIATREIKTICCYTEARIVSSSSKFAPKEMVVYKVPTLDECIGMLPRAVGNYILSFTSFWIEFYLQNIQKKYGNKFLIEMIDKYLCCNNRDPLTNHCCGRMEFRGRSKLNQEEIINKMIFSIITNYREKKNIPIAFQRCLENKHKMIVKKENILSTLAVGDILRNDSRSINYLVIYVEEKYYKVCLIGCWRYENEYFVWIRDNNIRKESREKNKLQFSERLSRKIVKSQKTSLEIDFTKPVAEIYYQL
jgi:hypothetical protein